MKSKRREFDIYLFIFFPKDVQDQTEGRVTRSSSSLKSPEVKVQAKGKGKKRGRKRKADENSFKISDFVDSQV